MTALRGTIAVALVMAVGAPARADFNLYNGFFRTDVVITIPDGTQGVSISLGNVNQKVEFGLPQQSGDGIAHAPKPSAVAEAGAPGTGQLRIDAGVDGNVTCPGTGYAESTVRARTQDLIVTNTTDKPFDGTFSYTAEIDLSTRKDCPGSAEILAVLQLFVNSPGKAEDRIDLINPDPAFIQGDKQRFHDTFKSGFGGVTYTVAAHSTTTFHLFGSLHGIASTPDVRHIPEPSALVSWAVGGGLLLAAAGRRRTVGWLLGPRSGRGPSRT